MKDLVTNEFVTSYAAATAGVKTLLRTVGEDPDREGLVNTPDRVVRAFIEMTRGYDQDSGEVLATQFDEPFDEMIVCSGVRFASLCEHHLLPFTGTVTLGYVPEKRVVGLSKLARLVQVYAKRLQIQERMTIQIADALNKHLEPIGVGVMVTAHHACMGTRGAHQPDAVMTTSALLGCMRDEPEARAEFMALAREKG